MNRTARVLALLGLGVVGVAACGRIDAAPADPAQGSGSKGGTTAVDENYTPGERLPLPEADTAIAQSPGTAEAVLAGGCFWCTEAVFQEVPGVTEVISGYAGGDPERANYKAVTQGDTGHAEAIRILYDPSQVTFGQLLRIFFATHNPTTLNRQGPDSGTQYRSAIFYANDEQKSVAEKYIAQLQAAQSFSKPIVTTLEPLEKFFEAEDYHQDYVKLNPNQPYIRINALPKVDKVRKLLAE